MYYIIEILPFWRAVHASSGSTLHLAVNLFVLKVSAFWKTTIEYMSTDLFPFRV